MKRALALLLLVVATTLGALVSADTGYFIIHGYTYPQDIVGGPFRDIDLCLRVIGSVYGGRAYEYHCELKAY